MQKEFMTMNTCVVRLNTLEKVKQFVTEMGKCSNQFDLSCGKYTVNATSVLGILSMDLTRPLELKAKKSDIEIPESIIPFMA